MILSISLIIIVIALILAIRHINRQPAANKKKILLAFGLYAAGGILILLVVTGRASWPAAVIGSLLPFIQKVSSLVFRFLPFLHGLRQKQQDNTRNDYAVANDDISTALKILGLNPASTAEEVIQRHRELMQKNHPDRGGSDYLASKINEAKDILLVHLKENKR